MFRPNKKRLSAMTFLMLSLGRAVVQKVIAERRKPQRPEEKQKGMRANTVAFLSSSEDERTGDCSFATQ